MTDPDEDTVSTEDDGVLAQLRAEGILGPFQVADWSGGTDVGLRRSNNEDRWGRNNSRFGVADGVGGNAGGEIAAETAIAVALDATDPLTEGTARDLYGRANVAVRYAGELSGADGLGTTLVLAGLHENHVVIASLGDSRAYRLRDGELELLTRDHNVRNELAASGVSPDAVADTGLRLDALTAYLGMDPTFPVPVTVASFSVMSGDRFLLCSDGIHDQVGIATMTRHAGLASCAAAVDALLVEAREAGGRDNATVVVFEMASVEAAS